LGAIGIFNILESIGFFWGGEPPPPQWGVLCGVQRYYNFSTLVDGDDFYLEYIILEHPLNRSSSSHNLHLRKQILMKRQKKTLSKPKKKKKKTFARHIWALEMKILWTIRM